MKTCKFNQQQDTSGPSELNESTEENLSNTAPMIDKTLLKEEFIE